MHDNILLHFFATLINFTYQFSHQVQLSSSVSHMTVPFFQYYNLQTLKSLYIIIVSWVLSISNRNPPDVTRRYNIAMNLSCIIDKLCQSLHQHKYIDVCNGWVGKCFLQRTTMMLAAVNSGDKLGIDSYSSSHSTLVEVQGLCHCYTLKKKDWMITLPATFRGNWAKNHSLRKAQLYAVINPHCLSLTDSTKNFPFNPIEVEFPGAFHFFVRVYALTVTCMA